MYVHTEGTFLRYINSTMLSCGFLVLALELDDEEDDEDDEEEDEEEDEDDEANEANEGPSSQIERIKYW